MTSMRTPIEVTTRYRNLRTGRMETWSARSVDGTWTYGREDIPGTPWVVEHVPTGVTAWLTSLPKARAWTATAEAADYVTWVLGLRREAASMQ